MKYGTCLKSLKEDYNKFSDWTIYFYSEQIAFDVGFSTNHRNDCFTAGGPRLPLKMFDTIPPLCQESLSNSIC